MRKMVNGEYVDLTQEEIDEFNARIAEKTLFSRERNIKLERDRRINELINTTGKSQTFLLMQAVKLTHAKQGRPLQAAEQAKETELLNIMAQIEAIETTADDAIANGTALEDIVWPY